MTTCVQMTLPIARAQGEAQGAACLEKTRQTEQTWPERAYAALKKFIWQQKAYGRGVHFSAEEAVAYCYDHGLTHAHDDRAFGPILQKLARAGVIRKSNITYQRVAGHGAPAFKWEIV